MEKKIPESIAGNISSPYGDSNVLRPLLLTDTRAKHFIPLWGQQLGRCYRRHSNLRNISYPYGDSNILADLPAGNFYETFHTPMGTATDAAAALGHCFQKHFIPLWGQQLFVRLALHRLRRNISYPYGDSNRQRFFSSTLRHETFYPPMGTATTLGYSSIHRYSKHFIPLRGQQHWVVMI